METKEERLKELHKAAIKIAAAVVSSKEMVDWVFDSTKVPNPEISEKTEDDVDYWRDLAIANFSYDLAETLYHTGLERVNSID